MNIKLGPGGECFGGDYVGGGVGRRWPIDGGGRK